MKENALPEGIERMKIEDYDGFLVARCKLMPKMISLLTKQWHDK